MSTTKETVKYRNLRRDARAAVCIRSDPQGIQYASLSGLTEVLADDEIWVETRAIVDRYEEPGLAKERMTRLRARNRVIISLTPQRAVFSRSEGRRISRLEGETPPLD